MSCAIVRPMWTAAVDPRVITARAVPLSATDAVGSVVLDGVERQVRSRRGLHVLIDRGEPVRLDLIDAVDPAEPFVLHFDLPDDDWFADRVAAISGLRGPRRHRAHPQLARRLLALLSVDARDASSSLRETADSVLGPGDWPGDGEHRKSMIRRMLVTGDRMLASGPEAILGERSARQR